MQPVVIDASIYIITALRTGGEADLAFRRLTANSPVWLSSVVLEELYAGVAPAVGMCLSAWSVILREPGASPSAESRRLEPDGQSAVSIGS